MNEIYEFFKGFDVHTIISVAIIGWFYIRGIKNDIKAINKKLEEHDERFNKIENRLTAIETGLKMFEWFHVKSDKKVVE